jgi:Gpi18-like mannosyltransferase
MKILSDFKTAVKKFLGGLSWDSWIVAGTGVLLALALRYSLRRFESGDYLSLMQGWYTAFAQHGLSALHDGVTNYPPLYEYILLFSSYIGKFISPPVFAMKLPLIVCDFICAWYIYRIVRLNYHSGPAPVYASLAALFAPSLVLNSSFWGQIDILYVTGLVACLYYILKNRGFQACLAYGLAISTKPQAIFLAPFLILLFLKHRLSFKYLLLIPAVYFITLVPSWIAGRPLFSLITLYTSQLDLFLRLTVNAPNMYSWFPVDSFDYLHLASTIFAISIILLYIAMAWQSKVTFSTPLLVYLALVSVLLVPYFTPLMHERYFFASDVISIVFAFFFPRKAYLAIILNVLSFFSYQAFLFGIETIPQEIIALLLLGVVVILVWQLVVLLHPRLTKGSVESVRSELPG